MSPNPKKIVLVLPVDRCHFIALDNDGVFWAGHIHMTHTGNCENCSISIGWMGTVEPREEAA